MKGSPRLVAFLAPLALLLGSSACGRGCSCVRGEKTYETLDGKVKVSLVRNVDWAGTKFPAMVAEFALRIETTPPITHRVHCDHVDMAEDDAGKLVAYRCQGKDAWNLIRLRGGDRHLVECGAPVGTKKKPDWTKVEPLSRSIERVFACDDSLTKSTVSVWRELSRSLEEDEGDGTASKLHLDRMDEPHGNTREDPWAMSLAGASPPVRDRVLGGLCGALVEQDAPMPRYVRAAEQCPMEAPGVGEGAARQLRALLVRPMEDPAARLSASGKPDPLNWSHQRALAWAAVIGADKAPAAAGQASCDVAAAIPPSPEMDRITGRRVAAALIAHADIRCDAALPWLARPPCASALDCDGGLCSPTELANDFHRWAKQPAAAPDAGFPREAPYPPPVTVRALLALAYARGPLDREIRTRNARRLYTWPDGGASVACDDEDAGNGTPCQCGAGSLADYAICNTPVASTRVVYQTCAFHLDDAKRRMDDVRRVCAGEHEDCAHGQTCCGGLRCRYGDAGGASCAPRTVQTEGDAAIRR